MRWGSSCAVCFKRIPWRFIHSGFFQRLPSRCFQQFGIVEQVWGAMFQIVIPSYLLRFLRTCCGLLSQSIYEFLCYLSYKEMPDSRPNAWIRSIISDPSRLRTTSVSHRYWIFNWCSRSLKIVLETVSILMTLRVSKEFWYIIAGRRVDCIANTCLYSRDWKLVVDDDIKGSFLRIPVNI